ncbi:hypothetical protein AVEN_246236-1 [Araneus ventricosus]|uniref:Uncharacterized protein n=1 Tax=Araneus ventricosus TaxID=182803 RepID=A0A4Y2TEI4_ARAVE|nr:hypothetical protein AVEN_246236-1 [Araneus ventricosus]
MRPADLEKLCLADFVAWYAKEQKRERKRDATEFDDGASENDVENLEDEDDDNSNNDSYRKIDFARVLRYRYYEIEETLNYDRELVTLLYPFQSELIDVSDENKFNTIYEEHKESIMGKKQEYESRSDNNLLKEKLKKLCEEKHYRQEQLKE